MTNPVEQAAYWDKPGKRKHPTDPVIAAFVEPKLDYISNHITLPQSPAILDVGCGNGYFTHYLQKWGQVVGLDYSDPMLRLNPSTSLVLGSALELPFADHTYDIVFEANLLHHLESPVQAIVEMRRVSRAYVVLIEPHRNNPLMLGLGLAKSAERASLHFTRTFLQHSAQQAGLQVLAADTMGLVTPNRMPRWIVPWAARLNAPNFLGAYTVLVAQNRES